MGCLSLKSPASLRSTQSSATSTTWRTTETRICQQAKAGSNSLSSTVVSIVSRCCMAELSELTVLYYTVAGLKFRVWQSLCLCFLASTTNPRPLYTKWPTNSSVGSLALRSSQTQIARNASTRRNPLCYQGEMSGEEAKESYSESGLFFANGQPPSLAIV
jgi:hypothetical protein